MSYEPFTRSPSGIVFFGTSASDPLYNSDSNFKIGGGYLSATNIKVSDGGTIGSQTTPGAITIAQDGDISIASNLFVNGTLTSIATDNIIVEDPLMFLASGNTGNSNDIGFFGQYNDGGNNEYAGLFRDASDNKFRLFHSLEDQPITTVDTGGTGYTKATLVADLEGNASTSSAWLNGRYIEVSDQIVGSGIIDGSSDIDISVSLTEQAINGQTIATSANNSDYLIIASGTSLRRITKQNFVSGLGGGTMSSFVLEDGDGTEVIIDDSKEVKFIGASGVTINWTDTDNGTDVDPYDLTFTVDHDQTQNYVSNEHIDHSSVQIVAGSGLVGGGDITSSRTIDIAAGDGITVTDNEIEVTVDDSTIELSASDGTGSVRVKDGGITERKLFRNVYTATSDVSADSIDSNDYDIILADATSNNVTITLPDDGGDVGEGRIITIKRIDSSSTYNVTINTESSDTIDGVSSYILYHRYESVKVVNDSSNWYII